MSLTYHYTEAERAEYGRKMRERRAAQRAADPVGYAARLATRAAEYAEKKRQSDAMVEAILAEPRQCLGWELVDNRVVRHMRGEKPETCERCAGVRHDA